MHPPIVVTVIVPHSKGLAAAAQRGWTPIIANFLQPGWVATHWPMYAQGCAADGRVARPADWRLARRSMELMAEKVMPAVNAAIGGAA